MNCEYIKQFPDVILLSKLKFIYIAYELLR